MSGLNWKSHVFNDGRMIEFVRAEWEPDGPNMEPGTIRCRVYFTLDGAMDNRVVTLTSEMFESPPDQRAESS